MDLRSSKMHGKKAPQSFPTRPASSWALDLGHTWTHIAHSCFHAAAPTSSQVIKVLCISFSSFLDYQEDLLLSWNYQNLWLYILTLCILSFHQVTHSEGRGLCLSLVASNTGQEARKAHLKNVVNGTKPDLTAK